MTFPPLPFVKPDPAAELAWQLAKTRAWLLLFVEDLNEVGLKQPAARVQKQCDDIAAALKRGGFEEYL